MWEFVAHGDEVDNREWARLAGLIASAEPALGFAFVWVRPIHAMLAEAGCVEVDVELMQTSAWKVAWQRALEGRKVYAPPN